MQNCDAKIGRFRRFTQLAYEKAQKKGTYASYDYLTIGQQLCHKHYMRIVEPDRSQTLGAPNSAMRIVEPDRSQTLGASSSAMRIAEPVQTDYTFAEQVNMHAYESFVQKKASCF